MVISCKKHNFFWIGLLLLLITISFSYQTIIFSLLLPIPFFIMFNSEWSNKKVLIGFCVLIFYLILYSLTNYSVFAYITKSLNLGIDIKTFSFLDKNYSPETSSFLKLFLLNQKDPYNKPFYQELISMSVIYLVVIGGLQMSLLKKILSLIFYKKTIKSVFMILISGIYMFVLNFNISISRVFFCTFFSLFFPKISKIDILAYVGIFIIFLNPQDSTNFGFVLSFFCTFLVYFSMFFIKPKLFVKTKINFIVTLSTVPFVIAMGSSISIFFFLYSLFFGFILFFVYLWCLLTFVFIFFSPITEFIFYELKNLVLSLSSLNVSFSLNHNSPLYSVMYFYIYFLTIIFLYRKYDNYCHGNRTKYYTIQNQATN